MFYSLFIFYYHHHHHHHYDVILTDVDDLPLLLQGGREVSDFLKYLAKESTDGLKGYDRKGKKIKKTEL